MLLAELAILIHLQAVRRILLVFHCVVVALLAFCASKSNSNSHDGTSILRIKFCSSKYCGEPLASLSARAPSFAKNAHKKRALF
jgi:hypothetical protein